MFFLSSISSTNYKLTWKLTVLLKIRYLSCIKSINKIITLKQPIHIKHTLLQEQNSEWNTTDNWVVSTPKHMRKYKILHCQSLCMSFLWWGGTGNCLSTLIHYTASQLQLNPLPNICFSIQISCNLNTWPCITALKHHLISSFPKFLFSWSHSTYFELMYKFLNALVNYYSYIWIFPPTRIILFCLHILFRQVALMI